jgi:predicted NAD-dependent protein-ADP-ribosyltransferase YbiA (DUF1768 family)
MQPSPEAAIAESKKFSAHRTPDWPKTHLQVMERVIAQKFSQHKELVSMLQQTGSSYLIFNNRVGGFLFPECAMY